MQCKVIQIDDYPHKFEKGRKIIVSEQARLAIPLVAIWDDVSNTSFQRGAVQPSPTPAYPALTSQNMREKLYENSGDFVQSFSQEANIID
jgi:hypothetical protein